MDNISKERKKEYNRRYYENHKKEILEKQKVYTDANKEKISEYKKNYRLEHKDYFKKYKSERKAETADYNREYYLKNREKLLKNKSEYYKTYSKTQMGRAQKQFQQYKFMDKRNGFEESIDFDARWIVENIYTKPCVHCGESDWHKIGCNRLDNSKPHTKDNVESCCFHCNCVLNGKEAKKGRK